MPFGFQLSASGPSILILSPRWVWPWITALGSTFIKLNSSQCTGETTIRVYHCHILPLKMSGWVRAINLFWLFTDDSVLWGEISAHLDDILRWAGQLPTTWNSSWTAKSELQFSHPTLIFFKTFPSSRTRWQPGLARLPSVTQPTADIPELLDLDYCNSPLAGLPKPSLQSHSYIKLAVCLFLRLRKFVTQGGSVKHNSLPNWAEIIHMGFGNIKFRSLSYNYASKIAWKCFDKS